MTYEDLFPMIKDVGFNDFFSGHTYADDLEKLSLYKTQAEKLGLAQETSHSTIPLSDQIWNDNKHGDQYIEDLKTQYHKLFIARYSHFGRERQSRV